VVLFALKTSIDYIGPKSRRSYAPQPWVGFRAQGEEGLGQRLVFGGSGGEAEAGDYPLRIDRDQQAKALVPCQAVRLPNIGLSGQPSSAPSLGVPKTGIAELSRAS
jgi:hypothetical protein